MANLGNTFFSIAVTPDSQDQFALTREGWQWTFTVFLQEYYKSLTICHGLVVEDLAKWPYIYDILLISDSLAELEKTVPQVLYYTCSPVVGQSTKPSSRAWIVCQILGVVWLGKTKMIPNSIIDMLQAHPTPATMK